MKMRKIFQGVLFVTTITFLLGGCALQQTQKAPSKVSTPVDLNAKVQAGQLVKKVDNFLVIFDASSSMAEQYDGESKLARALRIAQGLNQTIPDMGLTGGLRMFGRRALFSLETTSLLYGMTSYSKAGFTGGLNMIQYARGYSPMELAITAALQDLQSTKGNIALIVISDGKDMGNAPLLAARHLAAGLGERLCIYTIQVGDNEDGKTLLQGIAKASGCGASVNGDQLLSAEGMGEFVEQAFFQKVAARTDSDGDGVFDDVDRCPSTPKGVQVDAKGCPFDSDGDGVYDYMDKCPNTPKGVQVDASGCPFDSDGDGVYDYLDKCPNTQKGLKVNANGCPFDADGDGVSDSLDKCPDTPKGVQVDANGCPLDSDGDGVYDYKDTCPKTPKGATVNDRGCWILKGLSFDTAKWNIKPHEYPLLDNIIRILKNNPSMKLEIQGHTDNRGSGGFNRELSEKRARAVMEYFVKKGISSDRLSAVGYGFSRPAATNTTAEGRSMNRRVELKPIY
jgi:OmpA-OmpF porin, OOP family